MDPWTRPRTAARRRPQAAVVTSLPTLELGCFLRARPPWADVAGERDSADGEQCVVRRQGRRRLVRGRVHDRQRNRRAGPGVCPRTDGHVDDSSLCGDVHRHQRHREPRGRRREPGVALEERA